MNESYNHSYTNDLKIKLFFIGFYGNKLKYLFPSIDYT